MQSRAAGGSGISAPPGWVLFVFAEAPGSRPLAARRARKRLRRLFEKEIYPKRRVVADFLAHGVTRKRLEAQIEDRGGYHVIHRSGHGHLNLLELAKAPPASSRRGRGPGRSGSSPRAGPPSGV